MFSNPTITAMFRIKNEEEFLDAAVRSVIDLVDRVLLVDNLSTDRSAEIIECLSNDYPDKVDTFFYPYKIARVGKENWTLSDSPDTASSPHLSANYYNWCLKRCHTGYVLKWDGDMIALPELAAEITAWRQSKRPIMVINGVNVHPNRCRMIKARSSDREALLSRLSTPGLPRWATVLTKDHPEPRLFPRQGASYNSDLRWTQKLSTPFSAKADKDIYRHNASGPCYLHMKFCKREPWSNYSDELAAVISGNVDIGPPLPEAWLNILKQYGHCALAARARD